MFYGPGRRRCAHRVGGAGRPGRGGPQQGGRRAWARASPPTPHCRSSRWGGAGQVPHQPGRRTTRPGCWPRWPRPSPTAGCRSRRSGRRGAVDDATLVVVTHSAPDAALAGTVDKLAELDSVRAGDLGDAGDGRLAMSDEPDPCPRDLAQTVASPVTHDGRPGRLAGPDRRLPGPGGGAARRQVVTLLEGGTPLLPARHAVRPAGCPGLPQGRGGQPDRLVQGPRDDGGRHPCAGRAAPAR